MHGHAEMRSLYIHNSFQPRLPKTTGVMTVSPLLRELILHLSTRTTEELESKEAERLCMVTLDQLKNASEESFYLPVATDRRLQAVCDALLCQPKDNRTLKEWAEQVNMSTRSLSRLFRSDIGLSFVEYRQQARLFAALKGLAKGLPVTSVAMNIGFSSLSAFNRLFKKNFGTSPRHFFED